MQLNLVDTKVCNNCKIEKKFEEFYNNPRGRFNLYSYCKMCFCLKRKDYVEFNKEKVIESQKKYYQRNKEKKLEYSLNYYKERKQIDAIFKFKRNTRSLISGAFKRGKNQYKKNAKTEEILGCTIDEFRLYIQSQFTDGMTFENHGQWHLDHIKPISLASTEEQIIELNHYTNFQPLWAKDNLSKSNKYANTTTN